ncbi:MAG: hypothetical protein K5773_08220 [Pseudobutyrivibrio sp.]|nr:hypothetical protein [Pseudobutyrivibrio sp.]
MQTDKTTVIKYLPQVFIVILTVVLGTVLILLFNGLSLDQVCIATSSWNDEAGYFNQVAALVDWNLPRGYFGYSEQTAIYGRLGAWAPPLIYPFALVGKIFGWTYMTPIYFNLSVWIVAFVIFTIVVRPSVKQQMLAGIAWIGYECTLRYIFSCTPESLVGALFMLLVVFIYAYKRDGKDKWLVFADVVLFILVIMRGYYASFSLILIYLAYKGKGKMKGAIVQAIVLLAGIGAFVWLNAYMASPFIINTYNTDWITNPIILIKRLGKGFLESLTYIVEGIRLESMRGVWYLLFFLILLYRFIKSIKEKSMYQFLIFLSEAAIVAANWLIYSPKEGARQVMTIIAIELVFIALTETKKIIVIGLILCSFALTWLSQDSFYSKIPPKDTAQVAIIENAKAMLEDAMVNTDVPWDNTVLVSLSTYHSDLYAIPSYMGQNACLDDYIMENIDNLKSKYMIVMVDEPIDVFMQDQGYEIYRSYGQANVYLLR